MNVLITLTSAGTDTGPFTVYSNADNYVATVASGISRQMAIDGFLCTNVPSTATILRVQSLGTCSNYVDLTISFPTTTTTSTTVAPTTTTTTTSIAPATTTTTTTAGGGGTTTTTTTSSPATTTTTTTSGGGTTTTTTTSGGGTTTTTTSIPATTTTTTTALPTYEIYNLYYPCGTTTPATQTVPNIGTYTTGNIIQASNGLCYTVASSQTSITPATQTVVQEFSSCEDCNTAPPVTTTTTTTVVEWYQLTKCSDSLVDYSASYPVGTFAFNDRVTDISLNAYRITNTYSTNPGGSGLFISSTGETGCPAGTTTTTSTAAPVATSIAVVVNTVQGSDLDCLGTPYARYTTTATAYLYDQYNNLINAGSNISVTINTTLNPCYGGSVPTSYGITILAGTASGQVIWDSSRTVDCGEGNCLLETETYDCAASNTASLPWKAGTVSC